ncbi:Ribonucleoside-diphosphate reductase large subunit [Platanthera zijinensis]|uniref:Ribonucleoside-diphosphate reductase large subunit n=1 Tax=Platanthera zijinensis TaxID=2320716 RepID=A0AAP0BC33_9ASPA
MYVVKRDGRQEKKLSYGLSQEHCDPVLVAQKVYAGVNKGVTTTQLDELGTETITALTTNHPDYASVIRLPSLSPLIQRPSLFTCSLIILFHLACC